MSDPSERVPPLGVRHLMKLIVCGAKGRMGSLICQLAEKDKGWGGVEKVDVDAPLTGVIAKGEVIIDFTQPEGTETHLQLALQHKKPIVIGTTGLNEEQHRLIQEASKKIAVVFSPNMAIGVNILFKLTEIATKAFGKEYDIAISETHHVHKKDSPSGTAKALGTLVEKVRGKLPPIQSFREGEVVGEHTIVFGSPREHLALMHRALDRSVFAEGALKAAKWVLNKKPGLYSMADVLGL